MPGDSPDGTDQAISDLSRLPPKPRIVAGILLMAGGAAATVVLWGKGVVFGFTALAAVVGLFLLFSGIADLRRHAKRKAMLESVRDRKEEILRAMIDAKKAGRNPLRLLNEKGIHEMELRTWLLNEMKARENS